ncbi:Transcription elongation factor SPT4 [Geodia barretti]|uniref:Transcription elongation factor SPT4 n=2 Tax=Geodia barretti TaxID=519541 RepID=A0AA35WL78_GEOBA|nr:Transcription elongation factor SPT4 [Geodia barretti]
MSMESVPKDLRGLRACKLCSMVKSQDQFYYNGCDNCERFLKMKGNREMIQDCTSSNFDGVISVMIPQESWVSKWQRIDRYVPGCYAMSVSGDLPQDVIDSLQDKGVPYVSRDTSNRN